jgi:hypothetical protein
LCNLSCKLSIFWTTDIFKAKTLSSYIEISQIVLTLHSVLHCMCWIPWVITFYFPFCFWSNDSFPTYQGQEFQKQMLETLGRGVYPFFYKSWGYVSPPVIIITLSLFHSKSSKFKSSDWAELLIRPTLMLHWWLSEV